MTTLAKSLIVVKPPQSFLSCSKEVRMARSAPLAKLSLALSLSLTSHAFVLLSPGTVAAFSIRPGALRATAPSRLAPSPLGGRRETKCATVMTQAAEPNSSPAGGDETCDKFDKFNGEWIGSSPASLATQRVPTAALTRETGARRAASRQSTGSTVRALSRCCPASCVHLGRKMQHPRVA